MAIAARLKAMIAGMNHSGAAEGARVWQRVSVRGTQAFGGKYVTCLVFDESPSHFGGVMQQFLAPNPTC